MSAAAARAIVAIMAHLTSCEVAYVRCAGRNWLIGPSTLADSFREPAAAALPLRPAYLENLADHAAVRRLYASLENTRAGPQQSRGVVGAWLRRGLERGWLVALDISIEGLMDSEGVQRREEASLQIPGGVPQSSIFFTPQFDQPSRLPFRERCFEVIMRAATILPPTQRRELYDSLSPRSLAKAATAMAMWGEGQSERLASSFNADVFAATYELAGWPCFAGLDDMAAAVRLTRDAVTDEALQLAAGSLAACIQHIGVEAFVLVTDRQAGDEPPPATMHDGAVTRWGAYIERITIPNVEARRACAWGDLSPRAHSMATALAQRDGLATLASCLRETDFVHRFLCEFGPMAVSPLTRRIWEMLSIRWIRLLQGKVTLFTDEGQAPGSSSTGVGGAGSFPMSTGDTPFATAERGRTALEARLAAPALRGALAAIAAVHNPMIVDVVVVDIAGAPILPVNSALLPR